MSSNIHEGLKNTIAVMLKLVWTVRRPLGAPSRVISMADLVAMQQVYASTVATMLEGLISECEGNQNDQAMATKLRLAKQQVNRVMGQATPTCATTVRDQVAKDLENAINELSPT